MNDTIKNEVPADVISSLAINAKSHLEEDGFKISGKYEDVLETIDLFAKKMHDDYASIVTLENSDQIINGAALEMSALIVTLISQSVNEQATWFYHHETYGENSFPLKIGEDKIVFPMAWVIKRILNGESDSIVTKFNHLIMDGTR